MNKNEIYLAKDEKLFGPYTQTEFKKMQSTGVDRQYSWVWSPNRDQWEPIDPMPPRLEQLLAKVQKNSQLEASGIEVICHNRHQLVSGRLTRVTESGAKMQSPKKSATPAINPNNQVILNLLDPESGKTVNVRALLAQVERNRDGSWSYDLRWEQVPSL